MSNRVTHRVPGDWVLLLQGKAHVGVVLEVLVDELAALQHLLGECPFDVHHELEHFVVGAAGEQNLAREELVDDAAHAPHVHRVICTRASYTFQVWKMT